VVVVCAAGRTVVARVSVMAVMVEDGGGKERRRTKRRLFSSFSFFIFVFDLRRSACSCRNGSVSLNLSSKPSPRTARRARRTPSKRRDLCRVLRCRRLARFFSFSVSPRPVRRVHVTVQIISIIYFRSRERAMTMGMREQLVRPEVS
jgi:hypothetical protein